MTRGQAERLMPLLESVLADGGAEWADLQALGVGVGPGNFTGIRISVAAARGLALGLNIPAEGVTVPEAYARGLGDVTIVLPAPRGQVHIAFGDDIRLHDPDAPLPAEFPGTIAGPGTGLLAKAPVIAAAPLAPSIAHIAALRAQIGQSRPAPMYLRQADALPQSDPKPRLILGA